MIKEIPKFQEIFHDARIVGLAGNKNSGKTNNIAQMIKEYRRVDKKTEIYVYGLPESTLIALKPYNVLEISSIDQLVDKERCIIIIDEMQRLKINDRRNKDTLNEIVDFVYHKGNYIIFSSPNIREFNSVIGGVIEKWLLKSVRIDQTVNGSQLKATVEKYKGRYKSLGSICLPVDKMLIINKDFEQVLDIEYFEEADSKKEMKSLF